MGNYKEEFDKAELIRHLVEAALENEECIRKSREALDRSIDGLGKQSSALPSIVAERVKSVVAEMFEPMLAEAARKIAQDVTARFTEANQQAEKAYKNNKNASEHTIWWVVAISTFCALAVTILFNLLSR